jgi:hypothetical protein
MATISANGITIHFDKFETLLRAGSGQYQDQFVHIRISNNTGSPLYINEVYCINRNPASPAYNTGDTVFTLSATDTNRKSSQPIEVPVGASDLAMIIEDNYKDDYYNAYSWYEEGDLVNGGIKFEGLSGTNFVTSFDVVVKDVDPNTGYKGWTELEEYYLDDNTPTGNTKPNVDTDPDYVAPVYDTTACPLP